MFWVDESAEATADEDAAMMIAVKSCVENMSERGVRLHGGPLRSAGEAKIVRVHDGHCWWPWSAGHRWPESNRSGSGWAGPATVEVTWKQPDAA
jgi:hypothetical protein